MGSKQLRYALPVPQSALAGPVEDINPLSAWFALADPRLWYSGPTHQQAGNEPASSGRGSAAAAQAAGGILVPALLANLRSKVLAMLSDPDGEPSLGSLYRLLVSRLARAIQRAGLSRFNQQAYQQLDEIRIKLEAWADLIGVKKDVLEAVDEDDGPLANTTRQSFIQLLEAMDHVEFTLGLREAPSDG